MDENRRVITRIGWAASAFAAVFTLLFGALILLDFSFDTLMLQCSVCLFLSLATVVMMNALYSFAPNEKKIWGRIAVSFATIYAVFICLAYYSQITVVRLGQMPENALQIIRYAPGTWLFALDMLGYALLAVSTLAAAFLFENRGMERWIRVLLIIHAALAVPTFIFPMLPLFGTAADVESASAGGAIALLAWCALFAPICLLIAGYFRKDTGDRNTQRLALDINPRG